jgi:hypothetical protein
MAQIPFRGPSLHSEALRRNIYITCAVLDDAEMRLPRIISPSLFDLRHGFLSLSLSLSLSPLHSGGIKIIIITKTELCYAKLIDNLLVIEGRGKLK